VTAKRLGAVGAACLLGGLLRTVAADRTGEGNGIAAAPVAAYGRASGEAKRPSAAPYTWRNVEIVGGGFVTGIRFSPKQPNLIYARTDIGGAYRWNPVTKRWLPLTAWIGQAESNLLGIESLAADPTDARRVYLAAGAYTQSWAGNGAILRSADQGRTWKRTDMPIKMGGNENGRSIGERLAVDPNKNSVLYFGSRHDGLWKSADYAATWRKVASFSVEGPTGGVGIGFIVFDPRSGSPGRPTPTLYVGVASRDVSLYRSRDGGATWEAVPGQPQDLLPHHGALGADGALYLTYGNGPGPNGVTDGAVWKYDPKRGVWTDITPLKPGTGGAPGFGYAGLTVDAAHPGTLMVTTLDRWNPGDDLFRSRDGGRTWTALGPKAVRDCSAAPFLKWGGTSAKLGWWIGDIESDPFHPGRVLYVTGATIWGTDDATAADRGQPTHWTVRAQGLEETAVQDLVSPPAGARLISGLGDIGGFRHDDLTLSPRAGMSGNPIFSTTESLDFAATNPSVVARVGMGQRGRDGACSADGGKTWMPFAAEPAGGHGGAIAVSADGRTFLWVPRSGQAFRSQDRGATWTACRDLPLRVSLCSDPVDATRFYAFDPRSGAVYVSADSGASFEAGEARFPAGMGRLRTAPGREGGLWLTMGRGGLYRNEDARLRFRKLAGVQEADALGFGKAAPGRSYPALYLTGKVGGIQGVFRSDDEGASWVRINDDRHQYGWIGQVVIGDPRLYGRVYLGTNGQGILYADPVRKTAK
jgi:photosystem II stability/assembly factor-like uncharacterized protein